ncbi:MAG: glycosyltransferase family 4 protein [Prevotella sp.]|nr:glycosyltransferase family 4 protein [Prevotella sp.]
MRVALLIDHLGAGGAQRQMTGLAAMLKDRGVDVTIYTYYPISFYDEQLRQSGVACEVMAGASSHWKRFFKLRKTLLRVRPDVVVAYLDTPCILACLVRCFGGKFKLIVSERNTTQVLTLRERVKFWLYRKADQIVPNSYAQGEWIKKHFPGYEDKTVVIPNFVDLDKFAFHGVRQRKAKAEILVAASVWASKNTKGFIEAVKLLALRRSDFVVKWYGLTLNTTIQQNKAYMDDCQRLVEEYGLTERFFLLPKTKDIDEAYRKADFFCLPSFHEGTPNVVCEAMACALPVVCSKVCDNPRYVREGENGFLFDPHDHKDMADKLEEALSLTDAQYAEYGAKSRAIAEQTMSEDVFVERYLSLF